MTINKLLIKNYKNIEYIEFIFKNKSINYITGENSIGKSNVIEVIYAIFTSKYCLFSDEDFKNYDKAIEIECEIKIDNDEEIFSELIDLENEESILSVKYIQDGEDYNWIYNDSHTLKKNLLPNYIICYKYIPRDLSNDFFKSKRIGKFISDLIKHKVKEKDQDDINPFEKVLNKYNDEIAQELNNIFHSIFKTPYPELNLNITVSEIHDILFYLFELVNLEFDNKKLFINQLGRGRGYYLYPIIDFIAFLYENRNKIIGSNIIVLFDEPEVYLSPFLQRQFMTNWIMLDTKMINQILNIGDTSKKEYNIIPIFFITTHSSLIISHLDLNDIENRLAIHRMYNNNNNIKTSSLTRDIAILKQFSIFDKNILEGLFARKIILVEGDTEVGFLPLALKANNINIHNEHIYIIKSSPLNFNNLATIFSQLNIQTYILTDRDCNKNEKEYVNKNGKYKKNYKDENGEYVCERVKNLKNSFDNYSNIKIFVSDYWDFEESILFCIKNKYCDMYNNMKEMDKYEQIINTHFSSDEIFIKKLEKMRNSKKTIEDSYKLINEIIQYDTKLDRTELETLNSNKYCKIAADSSSLTKLPNYIVELILELQNEK